MSVAVITGQYRFFDQQSCKYPQGDRLQPVLMKEKGKAHAGIIKVIGFDGK